MGQYFGHYVGHWLSATAMLCNATSGPLRVEACAQGGKAVAVLAKTQAAWAATGLREYTLGGGAYLFPYS